MKNITDSFTLSEVENRLDKLKSDTPRLWGTMTPVQMLWHCRKQLDLGTGNLKVAYLYPAPMRWLLKNTVGFRMPWSKNMATIPGIEGDQHHGQDVEAEKIALKNALSSFIKLPKESIVDTHPIFGAMNRDEWGRLVYKHLDHHFRQFGV